MLILTSILSKQARLAGRASRSIPMDREDNCLRKLKERHRHGST